MTQGGITSQHQSVRDPAVVAQNNGSRPFVRMADVSREKVEWLWPGYLPAAKLVDLSSDPGLGKSTVTADLAARVSTGRPMPDGRGGGQPRGVLLLSAEDGLGDTIRPRLEAAGADLTRVYAMTSSERTDVASPANVALVQQAMYDAGEFGLTRKEINSMFDGQLTAPELDSLVFAIPGCEMTRGSGRTAYVTDVPAGPIDTLKASRSVELPRDLPVIEQFIRDHDIALVVIDVLMAYLNSKTDSHKDQDSRTLTTPLGVVADRTGACVLWLRHLKKGGGPAMYRSGGSIGIIAAARAGFVIASDPDPEKAKAGFRVMACVKMNLAPMPPALSYVMEQDPALSVAQVSWRGTSAHSADDILRDQDEDEAAMRDEAVEWLEDYLWSEGGSVDAATGRKAAKAAGFSGSAMARARKRAGVTSHKTGMRSGWVWSLPPEESTKVPKNPGAGTPEPSVSSVDSSPPDEPLFAPDNDLEAPI